MTFKDWQSSPAVIRVQGRNNLNIDIAEYYKGFMSDKGYVITENVYNRGIAQYVPIDDSVRIPGKWDSPNSKRATYITREDDTSAYVYGQRIAGRGWLNYENYSDTTILDYTPRLLPVLTKATEFVSMLETATKATTRRRTYFTFGTRDLPTFGLHYDIDDTPLFDNLYVLTGYSIYTNIPGQTQTLLETYSYSDSYPTGYNTSIYDTYTIMRVSSNNMGENGLYNAGATVYIPYMHNFIATRFNGLYYGMGITALGGISTLTGANYIRYTNMPTGDIINNPHLYQAEPDYLRFPDKILTSYPNGDKYAYIVATKSEWEKIFNASGMAWSYDEEAVKAPTDDDLHKPTTPGQPTNPTNDDDGDGDNISDDIPLPDVPFTPNNNAYNRYWITPAQLPELQNWIFSETFLNDIKRLWNDPAEYLINISLYPFNGELHDVDGVAESKIAIGNVTSEIAAKSMLDNYSAKFYGGTLAITNYYNSYLDYAPYTSAEMYIPYIGYKPININDVMGHTLELLYFVDWDTNILTATLMIDNRPLTMYSGSFGVKLAISGNNANQVAETIARGASGIISNAGMAIANVATGNIPGAIGQSMKALGGAMDTALDVQISPRQFGTPTPATGLYNTQVPHLIIHRPIMAEPTDYKTLHGYSASYSAAVSSFEGYLQCSSVELIGDTTMTETEQNEIIGLLKGGIYI